VRRGVGIRLPDSVPGVSELRLACENARAFVALCDLMGVEDDSPEQDRLADVAQPLFSPVDVARDGSFILPEEF